MKNQVYCCNCAVRISWWSEVCVPMARDARWQNPLPPTALITLTTAGSFSVGFLQQENPQVQNKVMK